MVFRHLMTFLPPRMKRTEREIEKNESDRKITKGGCGRKKSQRDRKFEVFLRERENFEEKLFIFAGNFDKKMIETLREFIYNLGFEPSRNYFFCIEIFHILYSMQQY